MNLPEAFIIASNNGDIKVDAMMFYTAYEHCLVAHPELEPLKNALEHCLGTHLGEVPESVMEGMALLITEFKLAKENGEFVLTTVMDIPAAADDATQKELLKRWHPEGPMQ